MINHKHIGKQIRELRKLRGWKQYELAEKELSLLDLVEETPLPQLSSKWKENYYILDKNNRRAFWRNIIKEVVIDADRNISVVFV